MSGTSSLIVNLFRILPSEDTVRVYYIESSDMESINLCVHTLRDAGCIAAPQYSEYLGLPPGIYFVCENPKVLKELNIEYTDKRIESCSYIMKYLVLNAIVKKVNELEARRLLYLPEGRGFAFSQVICCDRGVIMYSRPHGLFVLRPCLILRVEHYYVEGENMLFLLADLRFKRFNLLTLSKLIEVLEKKGFEWTEIRNMLCGHYYTCRIEGRRQACMLKDIIKEQSHIEAIVMTRSGQKRLLADSIWLNPHPKHTRDFIRDVLGENLDEVWMQQRKYGSVRPKVKIEMVREYIKKLLIENGVFPLRISNVEYSLDMRPQKLLLVSSDEL